MNRKQKDKKQKLNSNPDSDDQIYAAEKLLAKKIEGKKTYYLVKWKGWDNVSDNSWEPEGNILDKNLIKEFESNESTKKTNKKNLTRLKKAIKKTVNENNKKSKANNKTSTIKKDEIDETTNNSTSSDDTIENIDLNESQSDDRNNLKKSHKIELDSKNDENKKDQAESIKESKEEFIVEIESSCDEIENNNFNNLNKSDDNSKQDDFKKKDNNNVQKSNKSTIVSVIDLFDKIKNEQTQSDKQENEKEKKVENDIDGIKIIELKKDEIEKINENKKLENNSTSTVTTDYNSITTNNNQILISKPKPINIQSNSTIFPNLTAHLSFNKCVLPPQIKSINSNQKLINNSNSINEKKTIGIGSQIASSFTKVQSQNTLNTLPIQTNKTKQTIITSTFKPIVAKPNLTNVQTNLNNNTPSSNNISTVIKTTSINLQTITTTAALTTVVTSTNTTYSNSTNLNNSLPTLININNLPKPIPIHHNNFNFIHSNSSPFTLSSAANNKTITTTATATANVITTKTFTPIVSPIVANINPNLIKNNLTNLSSSSIKFPFIKNSPQSNNKQSQLITSSQTTSQISTNNSKQQMPTSTVTTNVSKASTNDKEQNSKSNENDAMKLNGGINKTIPQHNQLCNFKQTSTAIHQAQHKNVRRISPPPIFWQKHNNLIDQIIITDVKSDDLCVTIRESKTPLDFFKQKSEKKNKKFKNLKQKNNLNNNNNIK